MAQITAAMMSDVTLAPMLRAHWCTRPAGRWYSMKVGWAWSRRPGRMNGLAEGVEVAQRAS